MLAQFFKRLISRVNSPIIDAQCVEYYRYIESAYPSNHNYRIKSGRLIPKRKLLSRYQIIQPLFPKVMTSFAEIGSSKGFFVFSAANVPTCERSLGIDVNAYDIKMCQWLKTHLHNLPSRFENMRLHELAERIEDFGGPFQTVLLLNGYQYLYFGSDPFPAAYLDHDRIFKNLSQICSGRIIFNNRIALADCQNVARIQQCDKAAVGNYTEEKVLQVAERYFQVTKHGKIGRYPLWTLDAR